MITLYTNRPVEDKPTVLVSGIVSLTEHLERDDANIISYLGVTFSGLSISGLVDTIVFATHTGAQPATDFLTFTGIPDPYSTLTVSGIDYTFIPIASGFSTVNEIHLGETTFETAVNVHRVLNAYGIAGTDFYTGQTANPYARSVYANDTLFLTALTPGTDGNYIEVSASDAVNITVATSPMRNGDVAVSGITTTYTKLLLSGIQEETYLLGPVSYNDVGYPYYGEITLTGSGITAVNASGVTAEYSLGSVAFKGRTALDEFAEVSGLSAINLNAGKVDSDGELMVTWSGMSLYQEGGYLPLCSPNISGLPTQDQRYYDVVELAHTPEYPIFIFLGNTLPDCLWPRTTDPYGTWYFAGRVTAPRAIVHLPPGTDVVGVWVGYGNKGTWDTTVSPFRSYHSDIYLI